MKHYIDIKHISADIPKVFEEKIKKAVLDFQNEGYLVEIQQGFNSKVFSALVMAYK